MFPKKKNNPKMMLVSQKKKKKNGKEKNMLVQHAKNSQLEHVGVKNPRQYLTIYFLYCNFLF